ncbi:MAG: hypothetical protein WD076_02125 [Parvularculaceae bacterium]
MGKVLAIIGIITLIAVGYYMFDGKRGNAIVDDVGKAVEETSDNVGDAVEEAADDIDDAAEDAANDPNRSV